MTELSRAAQDVIAERGRQMNEEGFLPNGDDHYTQGELVLAAIAYILNDPVLWPWDNDWFKPSPDPQRNLTKAGALLLAEKERLYRLEEGGMTIRKFECCISDNGFWCEIHVDPSILTAERATEINQFWSWADERLYDSEGDVVQAVIKMYAAAALAEVLEDTHGGFLHEDDEEGLRSLNRKVRDREGWGGQDDSEEYGWCGIRVAMLCATVFYDHMTLTELVPYEEGDHDE